MPQTVSNARLRQLRAKERPLDWDAEAADRQYRKMEDTVPDWVESHPRTVLGAVCVLLLVCLAL